MDGIAPWPVFGTVDGSVLQPRIELWLEYEPSILEFRDAVQSE
jgi:hypothetical protein